MHASRSCIIVTKPSEVEPEEPTESIEPEPGVQFAVEPEVNRGKQLSMNPGSYLTCFSLVISSGNVGYINYVRIAFLYPL